MQQIYLHIYLRNINLDLYIDIDNDHPNVINCEDMCHLVENVCMI